MVHANALAQQPGEGLAKLVGEAEGADFLGDFRLLFLVGNVDAAQSLGAFECLPLREVHDVNGDGPGFQEILHGLLYRCVHVVEFKRNRSH